jgi:orsellinic acid C2-O-methyltransferase
MQKKPFMSHLPAQSDAEHLAAMLRGHIITQLIASAVRFGLPDRLGDSAVTDAQLSTETGIGIPELRRFLRALEGLGLVEVVGAGVYRGTRLARHLRSETGSLYGQALMAGADYYDAWSELDFALRTGESAFERRHGRSLWARFSDDDGVAASFTRTMRWNTQRVLNDILGLYDFPTTGVVADLGAGDGTLTAGLLTRFPNLRAIVFEQPAVIDHTRRALAEQGLADRCDFVSGSFFDGVPKGADLYVLKSVVHNWADAMVLRLLESCRTAVGDRGRLLLIDHARGDADLLGASLRDLTMLVLFGGQDRTLDEYRSLLERANFTVREAAAAPSGICLLEAVPPREGG